MFAFFCHCAWSFLCLFVFEVVEVASSERVCSYQEVLNYLNLNRGNDLFSLTRPVKDFRKATKVHLEVLLYAILDVREIDQTFVPYVWIVMHWQNDFISWDPSKFCNITKVTIPTDILWKPDLTIDEMTERDKAPPSPYLTITNNGTVLVQNDQVLVSTCMMQVFKFPFDVQSCTLSIKSVVHSVEEINLLYSLNSSVTTNWSRELMRTQYEWLFVKMTVTNKTVKPFGSQQDTIIYTIYMKRRSILYIVNFLLPVLFFLCLDLSSFLISDRGGEKISFKVTVLLAVTVMQLILNDILPSSSDRIPLIAVYCIGIFALMFLSLLETILMMHLMDIESESQENERNKRHSLEDGCADSEDRNANYRSCEKEEKNWSGCSCICGVSADKMPNDLGQGCSSRLTEQLQVFVNFSDGLEELTRMLSLLANNAKEEGKPGFWTRKIIIINRAYFILYVTASSLFLGLLFSIWTAADE
ncbi:PREDICTED: 5-hydroxytryptamine receptor 3A-like isoform X1 [Poecilia mexicana]|uniref:5-hydroxytryptamine receptor 3A-like isoform X1 n=1 Tax=Poecilia mexicana TaxID=48701 RepID=UPI00072DF247|nr:PREDICTED: 5-hydroxytryptamine receptor 3A-like isoform X1 [Poecilia mexicana]